MDNHSVQLQHKKYENGETPVEYLFQMTKTKSLQRRSNPGRKHSLPTTPEQDNSVTPGKKTRLDLDISENKDMGINITPNASTSFLAESIASNNNDDEKDEFPDWQKLGCIRILLSMTREKRGAYLKKPEDFEDFENDGNDDDVDVDEDKDQPVILYFEDLIDMILVDRYDSFEEFLADLRQLLCKHTQRQIEGFNEVIHTGILASLEEQLEELVGSPVSLFQNFNVDKEENSRYFSENNGIEVQGGVKVDANTHRQKKCSIVEIKVK